MKIEKSFTVGGLLLYFLYLTGMTSIVRLMVLGEWLSLAIFAYLSMLVTVLIFALRKI